MTKLSVVVITFALISASTGLEWCSKSKSVEQNVPTCSVPIEKLVSGRMVNGSTPRVQENLLPSWVNLTLAKMGQKWATKHLSLIAGSHVFGLFFILAFPDAYNVLLFTNESDTATNAAKRYAKTINEVIIWYKEDLDVNRNEDSATKSLLRVRAFHTAAKIAGNKRIFEEKNHLINPDLYKGVTVDERMWSAFKKDLEISNIPDKRRLLPKSYNPEEGTYYAVSQFAMGMTQYAFVGFPVLFPERLYILGATDEDKIAYNHLWAVLGYALGIDDEYNVALQPNLERTMEYYQMIFDDWYTPLFFNCDYYCKVLVEAMLKGLEKIRDICTPRNLLFRVLTDIFKIPATNMVKELKLQDYTKLVQFYAKGMQELFANMKVYLV